MTFVTCDVCDYSESVEEHPCRFDAGCSCWHGTPCKAVRELRLGVTYEIVTYESAKDGDAEERGWEKDYEVMSLRDLMHEVCSYGPYDNVQRSFNGLTFYAAQGNVDLRTGDVTRYDVHVRASSRNCARILQLFARTSEGRNTCGVDRCL